MVQTIYFNNRISQHLGFVRVSLILILFAAIAQFPSFGLIQTHVISFYGAQPEDISFALQIAYAGIITTLPIQFRMVRYFNTRSYLLTAFLIGILLNIGCLFIHDLVLFSILRFFTGVTTCIVAGCMLIVIFSTLPESKRMLVGGFPFFFINPYLWTYSWHRNILGGTKDELDSNILRFDRLTGNSYSALSLYF